MMKKRTLSNFIKRFTALWLCLAVAVQPSFAAASQPSFAAEEEDENVFYIHTPEEFARFSREAKVQSYSTGKSFILDRDIDLSAYPSLTVPYLDGSFEGRGHSITGLKLEGDISDFALFRYVGPGGAIYDLKVDAQVISGDDQKHVGILAGSNRGQIVRCSVSGSVNAQSQVGGLAGYNEKEGVITSCVNEAVIDGKYETGGIAGLNEGKISGCENHGAVNNNPRIKKTAGSSDGDAVNISIPNAVTGFAADERANETGGIAGRSQGDISYCKNTAPVGYKELGSDSGGIVGRLSGCATGCENTAVIYGHMNVGGIAGFVDPYRVAGLDRDYYKEIKGEFDDLSDAINELSDSGRRLGNDLADNLDGINSRLDTLRYSVRSYIDGYDSDLRSLRRQIGDELEDIEDIVDDMDYNFRFKKLKNYEQLLRTDIRMIEDLLVQLSELGEVPDEAMALQILDIIGRYQKMAESLKALLGKLEALIRQLEAGEIPSAEGTSLAYEPEEVVSEEDVSESEDHHSSGDEEAVEEEETGETFEPALDEERTGDASFDEGEGTFTEPAEENNGEASSDPAQEDPSDQAEDEEDLSVPADREENSDVGRERERPAAMADSVSADVLTEAFMKEYGKYKEVRTIVEKLRYTCAHAVNMTELIANTVERWPSVFRHFRSDMDDIFDDARDIHSATDDLADRFEGRTDIMKADVRDQGDKLSDFVYDVNDTLRSDWNDVSDDIDVLVDCFESVRITLKESREDLKSIIDDKSVFVDVSESDDANEGDGKLLYCKNLGEIIASSQAGGIAGSIDIDAVRDKAVDVFERFRYFDDVEDEDEEDEEKDTLTHHVRAVIYECENNGDIFTDSGYAGGICGKAKYGVISRCGSYCDVKADDGKWAGGIAGLSKLSVNRSYFFGGVAADSYVGGIAGNGENIAGNISCAYMDMDSMDIKAVGAVAGKADGVIVDNLFVDNGYGAVDGITKSGQAQGMSYERLVSENEVPAQFRTFNIRFMDGDECVYDKSFKYGEIFGQDSWPEVKSREGEYYYWEDKKVSPVIRNVTLHCVRRVFVPSVASGSAPDSKKSMMVLGGNFYPDSRLEVSEVSGSELERINRVRQEAVPGTRYVVTKAYRYELSQEKPLDTAVDVRALNSLMSANMALVLDDEMNMAADAVNTDTVKSYAAFAGNIPRSGYVVLLVFVSGSAMAIIISVLIAALVILLAVMIFLRKKRRKRKRLQQKHDKTKEEENGAGSEDRD